MTTEIDNTVSNEPWPWDYYIGLSKLERVILFILSKRSILDLNVWRGALRLKAIERLIFKGKQLTSSQRASFSRTIRRLERDGLINRERCISDDGYTTHIGLTQRGYYQAEFYEHSWHSGDLVNLLTFYSLSPKKYHIKVNK